MNHSKQNKYHLTKTIGVLATLTIALLAGCSSGQRNEAQAKKFLEKIKPVPFPADTIKLCTGVKAGNYARVGEMIRKGAENLKTAKLKVVTVETEGSLDSLERIMRGDCNVGIVQADALIYQRDQLARVPGSKKMNVINAGNLYLEAAHLICNKRADVREIGDMRNTFFNKLFRGPLPTTITGGPKSGNSISLLTWSMADPDYEGVKTANLAGDEALNALLDDSKGACYLGVSALHSPQLDAIDAKSEGALNLAAVNDGDFADITFQNAKVYKQVTIPAESYPGLQKKDIRTLGIRALMVANADWANFAPQTAQDAFFDLVLEISPEIRKTVKSDSLR